MADNYKQETAYSTGTPGVNFQVFKSSETAGVHTPEVKTEGSPDFYRLFEEILQELKTANTLLLQLADSAGCRGI